MKTLKPTILISIFFISILSSAAHFPGNRTPQEQTIAEIKVYYFHNAKRCETCLAVELETRRILKSHYAERIKDGDIEFISLNLEEDQGKEMARSLKIAGPSLLLVKGDSHVNLTSEGFMNARTSPEKFHKIFKEQIDKLL